MTQLSDTKHTSLTNLLTQLLIFFFKLLLAALKLSRFALQNVIKTSTIVLQWSHQLCAHRLDLIFRRLFHLLLLLNALLQCLDLQWRISAHTSITQVNTKKSPTIRDRTFSVAAPRVWNQLPIDWSVQLPLSNGIWRDFSSEQHIINNINSKTTEYALSLTDGVAPVISQCKCTCYWYWKFWNAFICKVGLILTRCLFWHQRWFMWKLNLGHVLPSPLTHGCSYVNNITTTFKPVSASPWTSIWHWLYKN